MYHRPNFQSSFKLLSILLLTSLLFSSMGLSGVSNAQAQAPTPPPDPSSFHSTAGPVPPIAAMSPESLTYVGGASSVTISGVPNYLWHDGCGPTSAGMVLGYWDTHGYDWLISGSAATETAAVDEAIASHLGVQNHYTDYSLPMDDTLSYPLADKSELPAGDEHASNSIADFMRTSWSIDEMQYGWSYMSMVGPALQNYIAMVTPGGYKANVHDYFYYNGTFNWTMYKAEIDAGRPVVLLVDSDGNGYSDHFIPAFGYDDTSGVQKYAAYNTWDGSLHWYDFGPAVAGKAWGIIGGTTLSIIGTATPSTPSGDIGASYNPTYTWSQVGNATWYLLQVNTNTPNHNVIYQWYTSAEAGCNGTICSVTPATTLAGGAYTWWVLPNNSTGDGPWSGGKTFNTTITIIVPPGPTTLVSPSGTISTTTPTYTWNAVSTATWYLLQVNGASGNVIYNWYTATQVGCASGTGTCSVTPSTSLATGAYTWWVLTNNSAGDGTWSSSMNFTQGSVIVKPPATTLVSPSGTVSTSTPIYTWNAVSTATWYLLQVNGASGNVIYNWYTAADVGCASGTGTCSVTPSTSLANGAYTWWLLTNNSAGDGPWSSGMNFTEVAGTGKPPAATLVSPTGTIGSNPPTYTWNAVSTATWYLLQVNGSSGKVIYNWYTPTQVGCASGTGTCSVSPTTYLSNAAYQWWVLTNNSYGDGPWSFGMNFTMNAGASGFNSQFNGSTTGWEGHMGSWWIDSGLYLYTGGVYDSFASASYAANYTNFQYEARLFRAGCEWCANSIWVRGTPNPLWSNGEWSSGYLFEYTNDGYYSVWRDDPTTYAMLQGWTYSPYIATGSAWNTMKVAANGGNLNFYINGSLVWSGYDSTYLSGRSGVTMYSDGTAGEGLWVDYATLNVGSYSAPSQVSAEQKALNTEAMQGGNQCGIKAHSCGSTPAGNSEEKPVVKPTPK